MKIVSLLYPLTCALLLAGCIPIYPASRRYDPSNEREISVLQAQKDLASPQERQVIQNQLGPNEVQRDGYVLPLIDRGTTPVYHSLEENRPQTEQNRFNLELDKRLHPEDDSRREK